MQALYLRANFFFVVCFLLNWSLLSHVAPIHYGNKVSCNFCTNTKYSIRFILLQFLVVTQEEIHPSLFTEGKAEARVGARRDALIGQSASLLTSYSSSFCVRPITVSLESWALNFPSLWVTVDSPMVNSSGFKGTSLCPPAADWEYALAYSILVPFSSALNWVKNRYDFPWGLHTEQENSLLSSVRPTLISHCSLVPPWEAYVKEHSYSPMPSEKVCTTPPGFTLNSTVFACSSDASAGTLTAISASANRNAKLPAQVLLWRAMSSSSDLQLVRAAPPDRKSVV